MKATWFTATLASLTVVGMFNPIVTPPVTENEPEITIEEIYDNGNGTITFAAFDEVDEGPIMVTLACVGGINAGVVASNSGTFTFPFTTDSEFAAMCREFYPEKES